MRLILRSGNEQIMNGISEAKLLQAGLDGLNADGAMGVPVDVMAMRLGISNSAFYSHFKNRTDFFTKILGYWVRAVTEQFVTNPEVRALPPMDRLTRIAEIMVNSELARYEATIMQWSLQDETVASATREVNRMRLDFVRTAFEEAGFSGDDREMRVRMFTCYVTSAGPMFHGMPRRQLRRLIGKQVEILASQKLP